MSHSIARRLLAVVVTTISVTLPGCEVGRSWFSMSSDSPSPWFGIDLLPRRKTSAVYPQGVPHHQPNTMNGVSKAQVQPVANRPRSQGITSRELHLPSIPAYFGENQTEALSFTGPEADFR